MFQCHTFLPLDLSIIAAPVHARKENVGKGGIPRPRIELGSKDLQSSALPLSYQGNEMPTLPQGLADSGEAILDVRFVKSTYRDTL